MTLEHDARFAAMLEECCRRVRSGERLEHCLSEYPGEYRGELARLVPLAGDLGQLSRDPSSEFEARLERRLLAAVDEERRARRSGPLGRLGHFFATAPLMRATVVALVLLVVLVGSGVGVIQASDNSLPDSPLYHVKTAREWAELALARNGETQVGVYARQINQRGTELERTVQTGKPRRVVEVLALRLAWTTDRIVDRALELQARGNREPASRALVMIRTMQRRVDVLTVQATPEVRPLLQRMRSFLDAQERRLSGSV